MAYDELLRLSGSTNNPLETITASGNGTAVFVGANRSFTVAQRVGGVVSGTNPTLDTKIQESANGSSGWTDVVSFPQVTASMAGLSGGTGPNRVGVVTTKDYLRRVHTVGGTGSPSFGAVSVLIETPSGIPGLVGIG